MMEKDNIVNSQNVETDDAKTLFVSTFADKDDAEIVAILAAWLSNGMQGEEYALHTIVDEIMQGKPSEYVKNYAPYMNFGDVAENQCFFRIFSYGNLDALIQAIKRAKSQYGGIQEAFEAVMTKKKRIKHVHEAFAVLFGGGTMFPTRKSNSTFYRYNLLYYWLTFKLKIWTLCPFDDVALLPCNDKVFAEAFKRGLTKRKWKSTLVNVEALTNTARSIFGESFSDFFKLYDVLFFSND